MVKSKGALKLQSIFVYFVEIKSLVILKLNNRDFNIKIQKT